MGAVGGSPAEEGDAAYRDFTASSSASRDPQSGETLPSSSDGGGLQALADDPNLIRDLLRKAHGDHTKVQKWLQELVGLGKENDNKGTNGANDCKTSVKGPVGDKHPIFGKEASIPDIEAAAVELGAPQTFFCPISYHVFRDPVLLPTGQTYERQPIERWLAQGRPTCPTTGVLLEEPVKLTPNVTLRRAIEEWAEKHAPWMLGVGGKLVPIPDDERLPMCNGQEEIDGDFAIAVRLQEHEQRRAARSLAAGQRLSHSLQRQATEQRLTAAHVSRIQRCMKLLWMISIVHVAVFVATWRLSKWQFEKLDVNPLIGFGANGLSKVGATNYPAIVDNHEWWRILVSVFVNAGFIHLEATLAAVWTFGRFLSAKMSFLSLGTLYMASGLAGVLLSANLSTTVVTAGASGAVFGLLGTVLFEIMLHKDTYANRGISSLVLLGVGAMNAVIGLTPLVDNWAAIGGLLCGTLSGGAIILGRRHGAGATIGEALILGLQVLFSVLVIAIFVVATICLLIKYEGYASCDWCRSVTCFNTRWWNCDAAAILPDHCVYNIGGNTTTSITCPSGDTTSVEIFQPTQEVLEAQCQSICAIANGSPAGPPAGIGSNPEENDGFAPVDNNL